jgi:hypothetical protein
MNSLSMRVRRTLRTGLLAVALTAVAGAAAAPAFADEWRHDRDGWRHDRDFRHDWRERHDWRFDHRYDHDRYFYPYRPYAYVAPGYVAPYANFGFVIR